MCINPFPIWLDPQAKRNLESPSLYVRCGHCVWCKKQRAKEWTTRLVMESFLYNAKDMNFLTLTYDDDHCPEKLRKEDFQKFMKRLRKYYDDKKIRFYACGEYGAKYKRPHYHAILFGLGNSEEVNDKIQNDIWKMGITESDSVTPSSINYVASYVQKKLYGEKATDEFSLMSRRPGLGSYYLQNEDRLKYLIRHGFTINGVQQPLSKFFRDKFKEWTDEETYQGFENEYDDFFEKNKEKILTNFGFLSKIQVENGSYKVDDNYLAIARQKNLEIKTKLKMKGGKL